MAFSKEFIEQVKKATDMLKLASRYANLTLAGDQIWQSACPHPDHEDDTPSFTVWKNENSWACYGCHHGKKEAKYKNYGSDCFAFLQWIEGITWPEAVRRLAKEAGIELEVDENEPLYRKQKKLAAAHHANLNSHALSYLTDRGLNQKTIKEFMIGFDGDRITFPLVDRHRRHLGFSNRAFMTESHSKYKNSSNSDIFHKGSYLYGIHLIKDECDEIRITEGAMDVCLPHQYGVKNIVATLGTSFTQNHIDLIKNIGKIPVFCMDGDQAGLKSVRKSADMLAAADVYCKILLLPDGMDMADLANTHKDKTEEYIQEHAITYGQMLIQEAMNEYDAKLNELNLKMLPKLKETMKLIKNKDEHKVIADYVYRKTNLQF